MRVFAEFGDPTAAVHAVKTLESLGYLDLETHSPFPITKEGAYAPRGSFPLALLAFGGGLAALVIAYLIQWYANVASYPLNIGGRPVHAGAAFLPSAFESICLAATIGVFAGFLLLERLPRLWQPVFDIDGFERSSVDRFWIVLDTGGSNAARDRAVADVAPLEPLRIVVGEDEA